MPMRSHSEKGDCWASEGRQGGLRALVAFHGSLVTSDMTTRRGRVRDIEDMDDVQSVCPTHHLAAARPRQR